VRRFIRIYVFGLPGEIPIMAGTADAIVARGFGRFWLRIAVGGAAFGLPVFVLLMILWDRLLSRRWPVPGEYVMALVWAVLFGPLFGRLVGRAIWPQLEQLTAGAAKT
jgi:hypothetical protein